MRQFPLSELDPEEFVRAAAAPEEAASVVGSWLGPKGEPRTKNNSCPPLTTLVDFLAKEPEQIPWIVDRLLPSKGTSLLVAKPKVGKTTTARDLAFCVARGEPFLGRRTTRGKVVLLALEEKEDEVRRQFKAMGFTGDEEILLHIRPAPAGTPEESVAWLRAIVQEHEPDLVIIDPLFRLIRVKDSNNYSEVNAALELLGTVARESAKTHLLTLHHQSKGDRGDGESILGSTAILGGVDTALVMQRDNDVRTILSIQRYGDELPKTVLEMDEVTGLIGAGGSFFEHKQKALGDRIVEALGSEGEEFTEKEVREMVRGNESEVSKAIRRDPRILRLGAGGRKDPYRYTVNREKPSGSRFLVSS